MRRISQEKIPLVRGELSKDEAVKKFAAMGEDLKVELIEGIEGETLSTYTEGDFNRLLPRPARPAHPAAASSSSFSRLRARTGTATRTTRC